jgi:hypothetical protein
VFGSRSVTWRPRRLVLGGLGKLDLMLESGDLLIHPQCSPLKDANPKPEIRNPKPKRTDP